MKNLFYILFLFLLSMSVVGCSSTGGDEDPYLVQVDDEGFTFEEVVSPTTGKTWMDRNLGAEEVCDSIINEKCYGFLYQWGRKNDEHQQVDWMSSYEGLGVYGTTVLKSNEPDDSLFIIQSQDWRIDSNTTLWDEGSLNNVCPVGWRVPTETEVNDEIDNQVVDATSAFNSFLKIPVPGYRSGSDGVVDDEGIACFYWTSNGSLNGSLAAATLQITSNSATIFGYSKTQGFSVRCIKE